MSFDVDTTFLWAIDNWRKLETDEREFYTRKYADEICLSQEDMKRIIDAESAKTSRPEIVFAKLIETANKRIEMERSARAAATKKAEAAALAEKASKKKLKKEKQKEKKNVAKQKAEESQNSKSGTNKKKEAKEKVSYREDNVAVEADKSADENEESGDNDDENEAHKYKSSDEGEIDIANAHSIAFIKSSIKGDSTKTNKKSVSLKEPVRGKEPAKSTTYVAQNKIYQAEGDFFPNPVQKKPKTSEEIGIQALKMIKLGDFRIAIDCLTKAINLDFNDTRHYINRSYCHLRLGNYKEALEDIEFASKHFSDAVEIGKAKCRKGQALKGLNEYDAAEQAFKECLDLIPNCSSAKRELKRVQITQIVNCGFKERDAILTLEEEPNTTEAIILLSGRTSTENEPDVPDSVSDDEIYYSDDEEIPSNETILSIFLEYDPDSSVPERNVAPQINRPTNHFIQPQGDRALKVIKTVKPAVPMNNQLNNDMAVWFADTNDHLTDAMFKKAFGKYGKISSMHRGHKGYGFVNFTYAGSAKKALDDANANGGYIDVNGVLLQVKRKK